MKSLPFGGTGKHKYSFQRIEVPPLPIHFCDCEEHCDSFNRKNESAFDLETANGGIRKEELSIMESVMKKLFEKESYSKAVQDRGKSTEERSSSAELIDIPVDEIMSDPPSDEDNLIINIVAGGKESMPLLGNRAQKTTKGNKVYYELSCTEASVLGYLHFLLLFIALLDVNILLSLDACLSRKQYMVDLIHLKMAQLTVSTQVRERMLNLLIRENCLFVSRVRGMKMNPSMQSGRRVFLKD